MPILTMKNEPNPLIYFILLLLIPLVFFAIWIYSKKVTTTGTPAVEPPTTYPVQYNEPPVNNYDPLPVNTTRICTPDDINFFYSKGSHSAGGNRDLFVADDPYSINYLLCNDANFLIQI